MLQSNVTIFIWNNHYYEFGSNSFYLIGILRLSLTDEQKQEQKKKGKEKIVEVIFI